MCAFFLGTHTRVFLRWVTRSGFFGLQIGLAYNILNRETFSPKWLLPIKLLTVIRDSIFLCPSQYQILSNFKIFVSLANKKFFILICTSVRTDDISRCGFHTFISNSSSFYELPVCTFLPFIHWVVFSLLICREFLYTVGNYYQLYIWQMLSPGCL